MLLVLFVVVLFVVVVVVVVVVSAAHRCYRVRGESRHIAATAALNLRVLQGRCW